MFFFTKLAQKFQKIAPPTIFDYAFSTQTQPEAVQSSFASITIRACQIERYLIFVFVLNQHR